MEIDLSKVIGYSRDSLQSRALMRAIMLDLYPGKTREMNVLLDVYESGVPRKIKNDGSITAAQYAQYVQKIANEYALQEVFIVEALNAWIDVCLGKGSAQRIVYKQNQEPINAGPLNNRNHTPSHVHNQPANNMPKVVGPKNDYELKDITSTTVEISKFVGFDEARTIIPNEINGKRVVGIGPSAFSKCQGIQELIVSEGIEYIGKEAFQGCNNMTMVQFPSSLKRIGNGAFASTGLISVDLPNGITKLEGRTFNWCQNLQSVILPDYLSEIGMSDFNYCKALTEIKLPASMRKIGSSAFYECGKLTNVELNEGLLEIGASAFKQCVSLNRLTVPSSVVTLGNSIFEGKFSFQPINITLYCYQGSRAIEYARNNNIKVEPVRR